MDQNLISEEETVSEKRFEETWDRNSETRKRFKSTPLVKYKIEEICMFCKRMPKVELHANLIASISYETIQKIYEFRKQHIPMPNFEEYVKNDYCHAPCNIDKCRKAIWFNRMLLDTPESIAVAIWDIIKEYYEDNTVYLELVASVLPNFSNMTKSKFMSTVLYATKLANIKYSEIFVQIRFAIIHINNLEYFKKTCNLAQYYKQVHPDILAGVDVYASPHGSTQFLELLDECREAGLKIVIHCDEMADRPEFLQILDFKPDRLAKCRKVLPYFGGSNLLYDKLLYSKIPVDLCLTSNFNSPEICKNGYYYFKYLYGRKHPIGSNGILQTTLSEQYVSAHKCFNLSKEQLVELCESSLMHSFATIPQIIAVKDKIEKFKLKEKLTIYNSI